MSDVNLFVRKASGLVRAWSVFDAFIYATFSINLVTLGLFIFSYCWYFGGSLGTAVVVGGIFTIFEVIVYASLISAMPRAGGDYVWQSRILGRGIGFLLSVTGWWFILWLWVPLYGQILTYEFLTPMAALFGAPEAALWLTGTPMGLLVGMLLVCLIVFIYIAIGMKWYARVQKISFYMGLVGLLIVFGLLLFNDKETFIAAFNAGIPSVYGLAEGVDYYAETIAAGQAAGSTFGSLGVIALGASMAMVPMMTFFNLWPNWGSTLYGEVRGATDYKRNFWGMAAAIIVTAGLALIFFALINKTMGWDFYINANGAFWSNYFGYTEAPPIPVWPYPVQFASLLTSSQPLQLLIVFLVGMWWFGWSGTVFLSSTRVIFAAALDRMLPEWVTKIEPRTRTPINALLLMVIPSIIISILYAWDIVGFKTIVLDATLVIAVTFFGTTLAGIMLPWKHKDVFDGSPIARYALPPWLNWIVTIAFVVGAVWLIKISFQYALSVIMGLPQVPDLATPLNWFSVAVVTILTLLNAVLLVYLVYYIGKRLLANSRIPLIVTAGLVFFAFLDWLLIEWFWDPHVVPFDFAYYGIGWLNSTSMIFMIIMYALAAAIYFGFSSYRKRQGIDVDKVYKEIPVE